MIKRAMLALMIGAACGGSKEPSQPQSISHHEVVEYIGIPRAGHARPGGFDAEGTRLWCWEQQICNVPCLVCYTATANYTLSCDHTGGMLRCGGPNGDR